MRYDRRSGETVDIQPQPEPGEPPLRWNWDSPLIISPHDGRRLYFAANRVFRSDDRANSWTPVSPDLSRGLDRNRRPVMGRTWSVDAVWRNVFTSPFGTIVSLDESPLVEGLLYAGTDDGLVQVSEDGGASWRASDAFPGVPANTYVADVLASRHDPGRVYAVFNNHKEGDFTPYVLRSDDRGRTWTSVAGDLPARHVTWSIVEDHEDPDLLFLATELGLFFTREGGGRWIALRGGVPTIAFRDLEIQRRENDLVAATFGRGFYILDDYSPLRHATAERLGAEAALFPVKDAWMYVESGPLGRAEKAQQGDAFFTAPNPPFGAVFTYHLRDGLLTRREARRARERAAAAGGREIAYPAWEALRAEDREEQPAVVLTVTDAAGEVVRRVTGPASAGIHRVAWDLRYPSYEPTDLRGSARGPMAVPGTYAVTLAKLVDGTLTPLDGPRTFEAVPLGTATLAADDRAALLAFQQRVGRLQRAVLATGAVLDETLAQMAYVKGALADTPGAETDLAARARDLERRLRDARVALAGDRTITSRAELAPPSILGRVGRVVRGQWNATSAPTGTHRRSYEVAAGAFETLLDEVRDLHADLASLHDAMEAAGAPWTPGRKLPSPAAASEGGG